MKKYRVTVNGTSYEVEVEEVYATAQTATPDPAPAAPTVQNAPAPVQGDIRIEAAVPGKIVKIAASVGTAVQKGDAVVVVESMKMEIPVVAPVAGTVAGIHVAVGDFVETGDLLASMNE